MKTQPTKSQRARNLGAAICALVLCLGMVALIASMGTDDAHAEDSANEEIAMVSATRIKAETVGWYATGTNSSIDGSGEDLVGQLGSWGYNGSGELVSLSGVRLSGGKAYIASDKLAAFLASTGLAIYPSPSNSLGPNLSWWELIAEATIEEPEQTLPNAGTNATEQKANDVKTELEKTPEPATPAPDKPTNNEPQNTDRANNVRTESEIFSLKCRQSESEAKIAELEHQGYEIVRVERLPKWFQ